MSVFQNESTDLKRRIRNPLSELAGDHIEEVPADVVVCKTKGEAIKTRTDQGLYPGISNRVSSLLLRYHKAIGAQKEIPEDDGAARDYLYHFHELMTEANEMFPNDIEYTFVYERFFRDVITGKIQITGFNLRSQLQAFRSWILQYDYERLRSEWVKHNGDKQPKLQQRNEISPQEEYDSNKNRLKILEDNGLTSLPIYNSIKQRNDELRQKL